MFKPSVRTTYSHEELVAAVAENLNRCDDPKWIAKMASEVLGPLIKWNPETEEFEEFE